MIKTIILGKEKNKDGKEALTYQEVEGYKLSDIFFAHKDKDTHEWVLSDYDSGLLIAKGYHTFVAAKEASKDINLRNRVRIKHNSDRYKKLLKEKQRLYKLHFFNQE